MPSLPMSFKQKFSIAVTLALTSCTTLAAQSGLYIGGNLGYENGIIKNSTNSSGTSNSYAIRFNNTLPASLSGFTGGAYLGYDKFLSSTFVVGGEAFANYTHPKASWLNYTNFYQKDYFGISLLPGWQVNSNNRLYARVGWAQGRFELSTSSYKVYGEDFNNKKASALETGLGWLTQLATHWSLRLEYDHFDYNKIKTTYHGPSEMTANSMYDSAVNYKPSFDQFTAGISYYFNPNSTISSSATNLAEGLYTGISAMRSNADLKASENLTSTISSETQTISQDGQLQGYTGDLHLGYRWLLTSRFNLATEIFAALSSNTSSSEIHTYIDDVQALMRTSKFHEKNSVGFSILPGYAVTTNSNLYARLGIINSQFTKTSSSEITSGYATISPEVDMNTRKNGIQFGAGYEVMLAQHWSVLGEYDHAQYSKIKLASADTSVDYSPKDNLYKIGVNYYF